MSAHHPAHPTNPLTVGAPLPDAIRRIADVDLADVAQELARAEVELLYATSRHRKAWKAMAEFKANHHQRAWDVHSVAEYALANDPVWKIKTGDVAWWRDEMAAQATTILALRAVLADRHPL